MTNLDTGRAAEGVHESTVSWQEISPAVVDDVIARGNVMGSVRSEKTGNGKPCGLLQCGCRCLPRDNHHYRRPAGM